VGNHRCPKPARGGEQAAAKLGSIGTQRARKRRMPREDRLPPGRANRWPACLMGAPGRIRTRDPLLIRHTLTIARRRRVWPDRLFSCTDTGVRGLASLSICRRWLPHLAPCNTAAPGPPSTLLVAGWPRVGGQLAPARSLRLTSGPSPEIVSGHDADSLPARHNRQPPRTIRCCR